MTKRKIEYWVIPPEQDAEFVASMEEVLETYAKAYDPKNPVLCLDEQPFQLLKETRVPIAATKKHGKRVDYEYERNGTARIFKGRFTRYSSRFGARLYQAAEFLLHAQARELAQYRGMRIELPDRSMSEGSPSGESIEMAY